MNAGRPGERKYDASNLPADTSLKALAAAVKARWICEQAHQPLKEELGLDHFEGRSWAGLHRHALMTPIACAFMQSRRIKAAGRKKQSLGRRHNQVCQPSDPSSTHSRNCHPYDALQEKLIAERASKNIPKQCAASVATAPPDGESGDIDGGSKVVCKLVVASGDASLRREKTHSIRFPALVFVLARR